MPFELKLQEFPEWVPRESNTVANQIDKIAQSHPNEVFAYYPKDPLSYADGYETYTYADFSNIINGLAHWLLQLFGRSSTFGTLAYVGSSDIRYNAFVLAANKAGYKMYYPSPRLSAATHSQLFQTCKTRALLTPKTTIAMARGIAKAGEVELITCPSLDELMSKKHEHVPYTQSFQEVQEKAMMLLHSSGTTGLPKIISWTHEGPDMFRKVVQLRSGATRTNESLAAGKKIFAVSLPFHAGGFAFTLFIPVFTGCSIVHPIQGTNYSSQVLIEGIKTMPCNCALAAPSMLEEIAADPELLDIIVDKLEFVYYAGGPISQLTGDKVSSQIPCYPVYAGTDIGPSIVFRSADYDPIEWSYFEFDYRLGYDMRHFDGDLYELVIVRKHGQESLQFCFTVWPDLEEYRNGDLFSPHPILKNMWRYRGRSDDMIVLLTGAKWNPVSTEQGIEQCSEISAAAIVGTGRKKVALILEVNNQSATSPAAQTVLVDRLWPAIQKLNKSSPSHVQLTKDLIMISPAHKTFPRSAKGTLQRRALADLYADEVNALYK